MEASKHNLVVQFIIPALGSAIALDDFKLRDIVQRCHLHNTVKNQELEAPGDASNGRMWFCIQAMAHSYHYYPETGKKHGIQIWNRQQFIFSASSLLNDQDRTAYLASLEPGQALSIRYSDVLDLMYRHRDIDKAIRSQALAQERYHHHRVFLLNRKPLDRVKQFHEENPAFLHCSSQEVQAIHVSLSLRGYANQLSKLRKQQ